MGWFGLGSKTSVSAAEAREALRGRAVLVDVREPHEWKAGHVAGALHIPLAKLQASITRIPKNTAVYVICQSGMRSKRALATLRTAGIQAKDVKGGMTAWNRMVEQ